MHERIKLYGNNEIKNKVGVDKNENFYLTIIKNNISYIVLILLSLADIVIDLSIADEDKKNLAWVEGFVIFIVPFLIFVVIFWKEK